MPRTPIKLSVKEITEADLNMGLLEKRTKAELIRMICHVANMANEYTDNGRLAGDAALWKLNLVGNKFKIRRRKL